MVILSEGQSVNYYNFVSLNIPNMHKIPMLLADDLPANKTSLNSKFLIIFLFDFSIFKAT